MAARSDRYESKSEVDGIEELSKKLTGDLRKHIRSLGPYPVLSDKWCTMADSLARIANISIMERKLPKDKEDATLWECEELALRYLLEDGKLNLCLRLLEEFRAYQTEAAADGAAGAKALKEGMADKMEKFEKGIGTLLKNAWMHVEALQTTDLPLLVGHIGTVLDAAATGECPESVDGLQSAVTLQYLFAMGKHIEAIDECRIMPIMLERHVVKNAIAHLHKNHKAIPADDLAAGAEGLALLVDTEEFKTHSDDFLEDDETRHNLVALPADFLAGLTDDDSAVRRKMRPLLDLIERTGRKLAK